MQNESKKSTPYILGLDVGTNSIGWAVVDCQKTEGEHKGIYAGYEPVSLRALNSRIFQDMLNSRKVPKNAKRREARGARNRLDYYQKRRRELVSILLKNNLLPHDYRQKPKPEKVLQKIDRQFAERKCGKSWDNKWTSDQKDYASPYAMRYFGLEEKLEPHELGRLLLHFQRRRGYFSNRGAKYIKLINELGLDTPKDEENEKNNSEIDEEKKKEKKIVLKGISKLDDELTKHGLTLGQYIWEKSREKGHSPQRITLFRNKPIEDRLELRADREMYEKEFDAIWKKQMEFHQLEEIAKEIKKTIFHQWPLQSQKGKVGACNIYPKKKRAAMMRLEFQEFRTLQVINNLTVDGEPLKKEQRECLLEMSEDPEKLTQKGFISWSKVAKALGISKKKLNYGEDKQGLVGNRTIQAISQSIGGLDNWKKLDRESQIRLVEDLIRIQDKKALYHRLVKHYRLSAGAGGQAVNVCMGKLLPGSGTKYSLPENGYAKHSLKAIMELLPHLRNGDDYYQAAEKIGKRDSITPDNKMADNHKIVLLKPEDISNVPNPIVQKALYELRRVVNSIIRRYGMPEIIRIELAREMKTSKKHRAEIENQQKENRKRNEKAEQEILEWIKKRNPNFALETLRSGMRQVKPRDIKKWIMWQDEQGEHCPYCQDHICPNKLFSGETEVDHILPRTSFSQNYMNTVVSCSGCNQAKGALTPHQKWGTSDPERWERIERFVEKNYKNMPPQKRNNLLNQSDATDDVSGFVERQLNDARYIATFGKKILEKYGVPVDVNNGRATSILRKKWGLNNVLPREPDADVYLSTGERIDTDTGEIEVLPYKAGKPREDHHHHAIDAFLVAMTDQKMLKAMTEVHKKEQEHKKEPGQRSKEEWIRETRLRLPNTWKDGDNLHELLKRKLNAAVISHMAKRKVWGELHKATRYGKSYFTDQWELKLNSEKNLEDIQKMAKASPDDASDWIADENLRPVLGQWASEALKRKRAKRHLPRYHGKELKIVRYCKSCMTVRKPLDDIPEFLGRLEKEWKPGKNKTWIADKSTHDILYRWLTDHSLTEKSAKDIKSTLKTEPPLNQGSDCSPIRSVKIAQAASDQKISNSYVITGSNHHLELFHNGKEGSQRKRKVRMVTMLEAARRIRAREPLVDETPSPDWHYELDLCVNDMVRCEDMSIFDDEKKFAPEHKDTPYFRVQSISSSSEDKIDIRLRHHSVTAIEDKNKWGLWRIQSLKNIVFKKVSIGNLGLLPEDCASTAAQPVTFEAVTGAINTLPDADE